jgi:hypothetical protein
MQLRLVLGLLVALLAAACSTRGGDRGGGGTPAAVCEALREEIRLAITGAPRTCASDADCLSYPGGPIDCGDVVDRATAGRLWQLTDAFRARPCPFRVHCAPRAAQAACRAGRCVEVPGR